jgi:hypothetical protein
MPSSKDSVHIALGLTMAHKNREWQSIEKEELVGLKRCSQHARLLQRCSAVIARLTALTFSLTYSEYIASGRW